MKKIFILILSILFLSGCGKSDSTITADNPVASETVNMETKGAKLPDNRSETKLVEIEESIIFNDFGIRVTVKGFQKTSDGVSIKMLVENETAQNIVLAGNTFKLNDVITLGGNLHISVASGKKANGELIFSDVGLNNYGIKSLMSVEAGDSWIYDSDTYETILTPDFEIKTSLYGSEIQNVDLSGDILFDSEDFAIYSKFISQDENIVWLLMHNNSKYDVIVQPRNVSVNDFMVNVSFSDFVSAGTYRLLALEIYENELKENGIEKIETVSFALNILNPKNYETITNTSALTVTDK